MFTNLAQKRLYMWRALLGKRAKSISNVVELSSPPPVYHYSFGLISIFVNLIKGYFYFLLITALNEMLTERQSWYRQSEEMLIVNCCVNCEAQSCVQCHQ